MSELDSAGESRRVFALSAWRNLAFGFRATLRLSVICVIGVLLVETGAFILAMLAESTAARAFGGIVSSFVIGCALAPVVLQRSLALYDGGDRTGNVQLIRAVGRVLVASTFVAVVGSIGLLLLVVPGVYFALGMMFATCLIVDRGDGVRAALAGSWAAVSGNRGKLLFYGIRIAGLAGILGLALLPVELPYRDLVRESLQNPDWQPTPMFYVLSLLHDGTRVILQVVFVCSQVPVYRSFFAQAIPATALS